MPAARSALQPGRAHRFGEMTVHASGQPVQPRPSLSSKAFLAPSRSFADACGTTLCCSASDAGSVALAAVQRPDRPDEAVASEAAVLADSTSAPPSTSSKLADEGVWYFAFGSNMSPSVLEGRRKVAPLDSLPCTAPGWTIVFNIRGFPYREPVFASVVPLPPGTGDADGGGAAATPRCVHGVAFRVSPDDWLRICASEWATEDGKGSYAITPVECIAYDGRRIKALTLTPTPMAALPETMRALPSQRYMNLLIDGSRHHGLDAGYQAYLQLLPFFTPATSARYAVGRLLYMGLSMLLFSPLLAMFAAMRLQRWVAVKLGEATGDGQADMLASLLLQFPLLQQYVRAASAVCWGVHNNLLRPLFGCGVTLTGPPRAIGAGAGKKAL